MLMDLWWSKVEIKSHLTLSVGLAAWTSDTRMCWQNNVSHRFLHILSEKLSLYSITVMYIVNIARIHPVWTVQHIHAAFNEKNDWYLFAVISADTEIVSDTADKRLCWTTSSSASCRRMKSEMTCWDNAQEGGIFRRSHLLWCPWVIRRVVSQEPPFTNVSLL